MPLWVVATPIGNLGDLSERARSCLGSAALVLCEDTRSTRKLLAAVGLSAPRLVRCDAHSQGSRWAMVDAALSEGAHVVLVSDAGTPGISDPGAPVVAAALAAGHAVAAVPGPSAVAAALSVSGFPCAPFHFVGFPPRKTAALERFIAEQSRLQGTVVMLESGRRTGALVAAIAAQLPDRPLAICREISKLHEEVERGPAASLSSQPRLGEVVLVMGPGPGVAVQAPAEVAGQAGLKQAASALAEQWGQPKRAVYQGLLALRKELDGPDHP